MTTRATSPSLTGASFISAADPRVASSERRVDWTGGDGRFKSSLRGRKRCPRGHRLTADVLFTDARGLLRCRLCRREDAQKCYRGNPAARTVAQATNLKNRNRRVEEKWRGFMLFLSRVTLRDCEPAVAALIDGALQQAAVVAATQYESPRHRRACTATWRRDTDKRWQAVMRDIAQRITGDRTDEIATTIRAAFVEIARVAAAYRQTPRVRYYAHRNKRGRS